ncbi:porin [Pseudovibrio sp. SPO723]|uniref:porin n=1 Tax=Nesiotobacter zosterae TaxID=392721 RepID=UPI0029C22E0C|nr:porin [Pseudovibrio sp. SPO723]MDX5592479.1 porin [Pseudovibrio sp. SPO723]
MKIKALLLATAGFAVAGSASAADLPVVAEPVDYVQVCDAYGAGFFKIPGKDTCLKIGGRIRTQIVSDNLNDNDDTTKYSDYDAYVRGYLYLTSMTDTEIGLIKTYTEFYSEWDEAGDSASKVGSAYVQFNTSAADILIGRTTSAFDGFTGAVDVGAIGRNWSDESTLQITVSKALGNGVTAALSVEDSSYRNGDSNSANFVGKIGISQGWGSFEVAGAVHNPVAGVSWDHDDNDATPDLFAKSENDMGYAIRGTATFNLDMIAPGDAFVFQAAYADSAASYLGISAPEGSDEIETFGFDVLGAKGYALGAGFTHYWTSTIATSIDGSYASLDIDYNGLEADIDRWAIDASIGWYPVSGLVIALDGGFANTELDYKAAAADDVDFDEAKIGARVQYTF